MEYERVIEQIMKPEQAGVGLQAGFILSPNGVYEVTFDTINNRLNRTHYVRTYTAGNKSIKIIRHIEKALIAHLAIYKAGMSIFSAEDDKLAAIYQRIVGKHYLSGNTLESGFQPNRRGYVVRTK